MSDRQVKEAIMHLAGTHGKDEVFLVQCEVNSVNEAARTCDVTTISGRSQYSIDDVALMPIVDDGVLIIPTIGSTVLVIHNNRNVKFICQFSEIDKFLVISGGSIMEIKDGSITFNDGSYNGLVRVEDLTTKLNDMIRNINIELAKIQVGIAAGGGSYSPVNLQNFNKSDYENTKVKHGK
jgi:hypothetical protein